MNTVRIVPHLAGAHHNGPGSGPARHNSRPTCAAGLERYTSVACPRTPAVGDNVGPGLNPASRVASFLCIRHNTACERGLAPVECRRRIPGGMAHPVTWSADLLVVKALLRRTQQGSALAGPVAAYRLRRGGPVSLMSKSSWPAPGARHQWRRRRAARSVMSDASLSALRYVLLSDGARVMSHRGLPA